jgi:ribosome-associated protein
LTTPIRTARQLAVACARLADDMKAADIVILDVAPLIVITDFFVVATCTNPRQLRAIADELRHTMKARGIRPLGEEGRADASWLLLDYGDVVVHLFGESQRHHYDIEGLWADAKRVSWGARRRKTAIANDSE